MKRKQFTFYDSFLESMETLQTNKEQLQFLKAVCYYALRGDEPAENAVKPSVLGIFRSVKPVLEVARKRAEAAIRQRDSKQLASGTTDQWGAVE